MIIIKCSTLLFPQEQQSNMLQIIKIVREIHRFFFLNVVTDNNNHVINKRITSCGKQRLMSKG